MRNFLALVLLATLGVSNAHSADPTVVVCDDCSATERKHAAIQAMPFGGYVVVYDFSNSRVKKYMVSFYEEYDGAQWTYIATSVSTNSVGRQGFELTSAYVDELLAGTEACGTGVIGDTGNFDGPNGIFTAACQAHDICYAAGGTEIDRMVCDRDLLFDLLDATGGLHGLNRIPLAYYIAVRAVGWANGSFNYTSGSGGGGGGHGPTPHPPFGGTGTDWRTCMMGSCDGFLIVNPT